MADKLGDYIVGTAIETIETEKLIGEFEQVILNDVYTNATPIADVAQNLQTFMQERGVKINTIEVQNVYNETPATKQNVAYWGAAENLSKARKKVVPVSGLAEMCGGITDRLLLQSAAPRMRAEYAVDYSKQARSKGGSSLGGSLGFSLKPQAVGLDQVCMSFAYVSHFHLAILQAKRVVMQSVARSSKVTPLGMVSKTGGEFIPYSPAPPPT